MHATLCSSMYVHMYYELSRRVSQAENSRVHLESTAAIHFAMYSYFDAKMPGEIFEETPAWRGERHVLPLILVAAEAFMPLGTTTIIHILEQYTTTNYVW